MADISDDRMQFHEDEFRTCQTQVPGNMGVYVNAVEHKSVIDVRKCGENISGYDGSPSLQTHVPEEHQVGSKQYYIKPRSGGATGARCLGMMVFSPLLLLRNIGVM